MLEILRTNPKLEALYALIANKAFQFCLQYKRTAEFRRLCDILRQHLMNLAKWVACTYKGCRVRACVCPFVSVLVPPCAPLVCLGGWVGVWVHGAMEFVREFKQEVFVHTLRKRDVFTSWLSAPSPHLCSQPLPGEPRGNPRHAASALGDPI